MRRPATADGLYAAAVARLLGRTPTGYQLDLWDLAGATDPAGGYTHDAVVVLWPRQCGKTTALFDLVLGRLQHQPDYRAAYTAQTGHAVTERMTDPGGWLDQVEQSPLAADHVLRRSAGTERVTRARRPGRGYGYLKAFPPVPGKLRGNALDAVIVDEAQEHDTIGAALDATIVPVFATRPRRQLFVTGTAGGADYFRSWVQRGRDGQVALSELGTWPADADPADPRVWHEHHPGLRAGLTDERALTQALGTLGPDRFAQEYGNRWPADDGAGTAIPLDAWDAAASPRDRSARPAAAGFDVSYSRDAWALVGVTTAGRLSLLAHGTDVRQLPVACEQLAGRLPVWAPPGQAGTAAELRARGVNAQTLTGSEYTAACQVTHDRVVAGTVTHDGAAHLRAAWAGAARSWRGDVWALSGRRSGVDVTPAAAAVCAVHGLARARVPRVANVSGVG